MSNHDDQLSAYFGIEDNFTPKMEEMVDFLRENGMDIEAKYTEKAIKALDHNKKIAVNNVGSKIQENIMKTERQVVGHSKSGYIPTGNLERSIKKEVSSDGSETEIYPTAIPVDPGGAFDDAMEDVNKDIAILEKYRDFEAKHANDFHEVKIALNNIKKGLSVLGDAKNFSKTDGIYKKIDLKNAKWLESLKKYNDSQPKQHIEIRKEYGTTRTGAYVQYAVYRNGVYDSEASEKLTDLMRKAGVKEAASTLLEITGVNDLIRAFGGVDPITGEKITSHERGLAALLSLLAILPAGKALQMIKNVKKGKKLLDGVDITKDIKKIKDGGSSKKASGAKVAIKPGLGRKLDYVFGKATGTKHNIDKSIAVENRCF